ncbi:MAG: hypothetical protein AAFV43_09670 [Planctomycetota bacterium]
MIDRMTNGLGPIAIALVALACSSAQAQSARSQLFNGSFDSWALSSELPDGWERVNGAPLTQVEGFGGVESAMQLDPGGLASNATARQLVSSQPGTPFSASFEFIQSPGPDRGLNFELRKPDTLGLINLRVQDAGGSVNDLDLFDGPPGFGSGWTTIGNNAVVDGTRYRLTITGDLWEAGALGSYDLLLEDLDAATTVVDATGLQHFFQFDSLENIPVPVSDTTEVGVFQFNTGRSSTQYTVDNATFVGVPNVKPGDYNGDGAVNVADYTVWRDNLGSDPAALAPESRDPNLTDPTVVNADYTFWVDSFGPPAPEAAAIPEPATLSGLAICGVALLLGRSCSGTAHRR